MTQRILYLNRAATTSRAVLAFCEAEAIPVEIRDVDLMTGEHHSAEFSQLNPFRLVPVLTEGEFVLTEASAILRYLARSVDSSWLPTDPRALARVDEAMAWFEANFYKDFGFGFVYPQILPHHHRGDDDVTKVTVSWGLDKSRNWLDALETSRMMQGDYLAGDAPTVADLLGYSILSLGDLVGFSLDSVPTVSAWADRVSALPAWQSANAVFRDFASSLRSAPESQGAAQ